MREALDRYSPHALAVLRIVTVLIFMLHGMQKLFGFPAAPEGGLPPPFSLFWVGAIMELAGGLLILVGQFTRPVAFTRTPHVGPVLLDWPMNVGKRPQ
jgi:putative oxidoreductase